MAFVIAEIAVVASLLEKLRLITASTSSIASLVGYYRLKKGGYLAIGIKLRKIETCQVGKT
jgi:hypothetical protein